MSRVLDDMVPGLPGDELAQFFELSLDLLSIGRADGYFTRVNAAFTRVLGWTAEEMCARPWTDFVHPDDLAGTLAAGQALQSGEPVSAFANRYRCKDGTYRWLEWRVTPLPAANQTYAVARDVTAQRAAVDVLEATRAELADRNAQLLAREADAVARATRSELQFRELIDNLPELAWTARPDGSVDFYNRRWYEYTGTTFEAMQGWGWEAVHHPAMLAGVTAMWTRSITDGVPFEMDFPLRGKDGVYRWFLTRVRPLRDASGAIVRWFGSNTNIDELRRLQQDLERAVLEANQAVASLRLALRAARAGSFEIDLTTRRRTMSAELTELFGISPDVPADQRLPIVVDEDRAQLDADWAIAIERDTYELHDYRIARPADGEIRWMKTFTMRGPDDAGRSTHLLGITLDITDRKLVEQALFTSRERYRASFEQAGGGIAEVGLDGSWLRVNERLAQLVGYTREELMARTFQDITYPDDLAPDLELVAELLEGKRTSYTLQKRYIRKDGRVIWVLLTVALVRSADGAPAYFIAVIEDIDELHALRQSLERRVAERTADLEAANRELETFSYSVSHDLRAPLRAINGFARALREQAWGALDENGRHYITRIETGSVRMGQLIDDLLALSRVGRAPLGRHAVDLSALVATIRDANDDAGRARWTIQPHVQARADAALLRIALENLLGNALKFTRERAEPSVEFGATVRDGERVYFVRDNGAGFDMGHAKNLFGPFQRLHPSSRFEGSGIGLATVQRIVSRHGGRIWAESQPEQGATFFFTLGPTEGGHP